MKTQFSLKIENPCDANYNEMVPNEAGAFCKLCTKNVVDLTQKTDSEIVLLTQNNKGLCVKMTEKQLQSTYQYPKTNNPIQNLKYASAIAASLLLASPAFGQEKKSTPENQTVHHVENDLHVKGELAPFRIITFNGKVLDAKTKKPLSVNELPNLEILVHGASSYVKVNEKTGEYQITVELLFSSEDITVYFKTSNHLLCHKTLKIKQSQIKNGTYNLDVNLNPEAFKLAKEEIHVLGKFIKQD